MTLALFCLPLSKFDMFTCVCFTCNEFHSIFSITGGTRFWDIWWGNTKGRQFSKLETPNQDKTLNKQNSHKKKMVEPVQPVQVNFSITVLKSNFWTVILKNKKRSFQYLMCVLIPSLNHFQGYYKRASFLYLPSM